MRDFAAVDLETANEQPSSVCSVGVVIVRDGEIVDSFYSLIHPAPEYYQWFCQQVHGLGGRPGEDAEGLCGLCCNGPPCRMSEGVQIIQLYLSLDISNIFIMCQPIRCNHNGMNCFLCASHGLKHIPFTNEFLSIIRTDGEVLLQSYLHHLVRSNILLLGFARPRSLFP